MTHDSKTCFKCGETKPLAAFYKHKAMADGHLNKCKECTKKDADKHRSENLDKIREYDRNRGNRLPKGYVKEYRSRYPKKYKAHYMVNNAIRGGKLFVEPCEICGITESVHAHHNDYAKPLNVRWLCAAHHQQWHAKNGEAANP
jgi:hypothetical protein